MEFVCVFQHDLCKRSVNHNFEIDFFRCNKSDNDETLRRTIQIEQ